MSPRDSRDFVPALVALCENPRLLLRRPSPPSARSGEDLKPTNRLPLRFVQKLSVRHVSNSLSTQRRQTIDPAPTRGRCGLTTAYLTRGEVNVNALIASDSGRLEPFVFDTDDHFYQGAASPMFAIWRRGSDPLNWYHVNAETVAATFGSPTRVEQLPGGFTVAILREPPPVNPSRVFVEISCNSPFEHNQRLRRWPKGASGRALESCGFCKSVELVQSIHVAARRRR